MVIPIYLVRLVMPVSIQGQKCSKMFLHQGLSFNVIYHFSSISKSTRAAIAKFKKLRSLLELSEIFDILPLWSVRLRIAFNGRKYGAESVQAAKASYLPANLRCAIVQWQSAYTFPYKRHKFVL